MNGRFIGNSCQLTQGGLSTATKDGLCCFSMSARVRLL
jgi:hypothetical protein